MHFKFVGDKVQVVMEEFTLDTIADFPKLIDIIAEDPAGQKLFEVRELSEKNPLLGTELAQSFHRTTAKLLYLCARARRDIRTPVEFLTTRVRAPDTNNWAKLRRVLRYLYCNPGLPLTLEGDNLEVMDWHVDAFFAVYPDMKGHTSGTMTLGKGSVIYLLRKQRFNTRSSTESEIVGVDDCLGKMEWTKHFLRSQGYVTNVVLHQDNMSSIKMEVNGKRSSTQHTRHLNIKFFYVTDQIKQGWLTVKYCTTKEMVADIFTKPLNGILFRQLRAKIMNCPVNLEPAKATLASHDDELQECVGREGTQRDRKITWADVARRKR